MKQFMMFISLLLVYTAASTEIIFAKDYKAVIREKAELVLNGGNYSEPLSLNPLYQVNQRSNGTYGAVKMPAGDMLRMISMIGTGYVPHSVIPYSNIKGSMKEDIERIFSKYLENSDVISVVKKGEKTGYLVFAKRKNIWLLKVIYLPGGVMFYRQQIKVEKR
jgi:hypothetical protein